MTASDGADDKRLAEDLLPARSRPETAPAPVRVSFWLWAASAVILAVCYVVPVIFRQQIIEQNVKATPRLPADQVASGTTTFLVVLLIGAISFAALYVLFAYKARQGTRSARTVLTLCFGVALVFQLFAGLFQLVLALLSMLVALIALLLMYLPGVWAYYPKASAAGADLGGISSVLKRRRP